MSGDKEEIAGFAAHSSLSKSCSDAVTPSSSSPEVNSVQRSCGANRRSSQAGWTSEEDKLLSEAVLKYKGKSWKKIAECVPSRTDVQCLHRWQKVLNPDLVKGTWTKEEDDRMIDMIRNGCRKWCEIAKVLPGRIGKQCRERWLNHLNPVLRKDAWTDEEESILMHCQREFGNKWTEIASYLPGRSENAIKNHWNGPMKRRLHSISQPNTHNNPTTHNITNSSYSSPRQSTTYGSAKRRRIDGDDFDCSDRDDMSLTLSPQSVNEGHRVVSTELKLGVSVDDDCGDGDDQRRSVDCAFDLNCDATDDDVLRSCTDPADVVTLTLFR